MFENLFTNAGYVQRGMDAAVLRNQVINNNIVNAETPGFKSSSVEFENLFNEALGGSFSTKTTNSKHIEFRSSLKNVQPTVVQNTSTSQRMDENNVDIDYQNALLAKNQLYYTALQEKLNSEYRRLRMAIREGS